jgi:hypothetical protein
MRTTIALFAALTATTLTAAAQTAPPPTTKPQPPSLGPLVSYQYWPTQYIQFLTGPELPYVMFMFEADTSNSKHPSYHASFTTRDGKRIHYSNTDALTLYYKASGEESYKTEFAAEIDDSDKVGAASTIRFSTRDEKPVEFRFVQGSDVSTQGSGLQPIPTAPIPILAYRELGAVAGEGTALKVGDTVSTAEVWTEISHPPYFVAYRGAMTSSAHSLVFYKGTQTWTVAKYPAALTTGNTWELDDDRHDHLSLKIDKVDGPHFTLSANDRFHPEVNIVVEATRTGDAFTTDRVLYMPASKGGDKHTAALTFTPGLGTAAAPSTMDLSIAKKKSIATATLTTTGDAADRTTTVQFTAPAWLASKSLTEETKTTGDTVTITAR